MDKEEIHPLERSDKEHDKSSKDVKKLISEGTLSVFREENQIKVRPASESSEPDEAKKKVKTPFNEKESRYYLYSCQKFREENWILMALSAIMSILILLLHILIPQVNLSNISRDVALFFIGLSEISLFMGIILAVLANAFFNRFLVLATQETLLGERRNLLTFLSKGYANKQGAKILWMGGMGFLILFLFFYLANFSVILCLCIMMVVLGLSIWLYAYTKMLEKTGILRLPRTKLPVLEEDVSNVYPGEIQDDSKTELDTQIILSGILSVMKSGGAKVRRNAVKSLSKLATPEAIKILLDALEDSVPAVRAQAVAALGRTGEKSVRDVVQCLLDDETPEVRIAAAEALGNLQDKGAVDVLIQSLEDSCPEVRGAAADALGNLHKKKSIKPLLTRIKDEDWFVRHKVIIALGKMKADLSIDAIEKIIQARLDEHDFVSSAAKHVLKKLSEDMSQEDPMYDEISKILEQEKPQESSQTAEVKLPDSNSEPAKAVLSEPVSGDSTSSEPTPAIPVAENVEKQTSSEVAPQTQQPETASNVAKKEDPKEGESGQ